MEHTVLLGTPARPRERAAYEVENSDAGPASKSACEKINHQFLAANSRRNLLSGSQGLKENTQWLCRDLSADIHFFIYQIISHSDGEGLDCSGTEVTRFPLPAPPAIYEATPTPFCGTALFPEMPAGRGLAAAWYYQLPCLMDPCSLDF